MSKIRFIDNDYSSWATVTATSSASGFPYTNAATARRSLVWKPSGNWTITSSNNQIHFDDGTIKAASVPVGNYSATTLATAIATALNAVSSTWSASFSTTTYKWTLARGISATLRLQTSTNAIWDTLGFTTTSGIPGTSWTADQIRIHTNERYEWSLGVPQAPTFFGAIGLLSEAFTVSNTATCRLMGNNMPVWDSPGFSVTLGQTDRGIHEFLTNTDPYTYWAFDVVDRTNPLGPEGLKFGRIWLGDHATLTVTNVARGFQKRLDDPTDVLTSESGVRFYNQKTKFRRLSALEVTNMNETDRLEMERVFNLLGTSESFFLAVDPTLVVTPTEDDLTMYGTFDDAPRLKHLFKDYYSMSFDFREAV